MPSGDTWTDIRLEPEPAPLLRLSWWKRLAMPVLFVGFIVASTAYAESKQRVRDAVQLRRDNESIALDWLAWQAAERASSR